MDQVILLLENTVNGTQKQIDEATGMLNGARETQFAELMQSLSMVLSSETASGLSRRQAALFIKNSVSSEKWFAVDKGVRSAVKGRVLNALAAKDRLVGGQAAQALAALALLELPREEWPALIPSLCGACDQKNPDELKESAMKALGYICAGIEETHVADSIRPILNAVCQNMASLNDKVHSAALEALQNMVFFLTPVFQVKAERDALVSVIFQNCTHSDDDIKKSAFSILSDVISEYYQFMNDYMEAVVRLTLPMIQKCEEDEDVVKQAIEIWITVAEIEAEKALNEDEAFKAGCVIEEYDKSRRYIENHLLDILTALFYPLTHQDPDADDDEWNMSHASATCISYIADCVREKIVPPVLKIFTENVQNPSWNVRDAATIMWGSILDGPPTEALAPYLRDPNLLKLFLDHMKDSNVTVRASTAWTLGRMCELHVGLVVSDKPRFDAIYEAFKQSLQDDAKVATMCCWGLMTLAEALDDFIKESSVKAPNPLAGHFFELVDALFKCGERRECPPKQRKGTYQALCALVHCSTKECMEQVARVTVMCLDRLEMMTSVESPPDKKDADELEALVSGLMSECVTKLEANISPIAERVCRAYLTLYQKGHGAASQEEAVLGVGTFASALGDGIVPYASAIADMLKDCIKKPDEVDTCRAALGSICDLARALEDKFSGLAPGFIPLLSPLLSPHCDRRIFAPVFIAFGDIAQYATKELAPYVAQIIGIAQQAVASRVDVKDEDDMDFLFELQEACFTCIAGIQSGLNSLNAVSSILQFSGNITQCIITAFGNMNRPESLSCAIVGAICDLVIAAGPRTREAIAPGKPWAEFPAMIKSIQVNASEQMTKDTCNSALEWIKRNMQ